MSIGIAIRSVPPRRGWGAAVLAAAAGTAVAVAAGTAVGARVGPGALVGGGAALVGGGAVLEGAAGPHAARSSTPVPEASSRSAVRRLTARSGGWSTDMAHFRL